jgi:hypothetical protein
MTSTRRCRTPSRTIYFLRLGHGEVWMLTIYAKNEASNIPAHVLKRIKEDLGGED